MQAQAATFDTYAFVKRLTRAGMPEDQAKVLANGQADLYERLEQKLIIKLGAIVVIGITVLSVLDKFF